MENSGNKNKLSDSLHENQQKIFINDNKQYLFHMQIYHMVLEGQIKKENRSINVLPNNLQKNIF